MNKRIIIATVLLVAAGLQAAWAQGIRVWQNGRSVYYELGSVDSIAFDDRNVINGHEWVDLGLPSGTLWATCNIGANAPEKYGSYFAWGETSTKRDYSSFYYKYWQIGYYKGYTKYCRRSDQGSEGYHDTLTELEPEDDAATVRWGELWQMPSLEQMVELLDKDYTTVIGTTLNGYNGSMITSNINGRSLFLPATGSRQGEDSEYTSEVCLYWSRSLAPSSSDASYLCIDESFGPWDDDWFWDYGDDFFFIDRSDGLTVRPVRK